MGCLCEVRFAITIFVWTAARLLRVSIAERSTTIIPVRRHRSPGSEALGLAEGRGGASFLADFVDDFLNFDLQFIRVTRDSGVDDDVAGLDLTLGGTG